MPLMRFVSTRWAQGVSSLRWRCLVWLELHQPALTALDAWLSSQDPLHVPARCLATRAHLLAGLRRWDSARQQLTALTHLQPLHAAHWFNLGFVADHMGDPVAAVQAFDRAVQLQPTMDAAWYGLGVARHRLGQLDEAVHALTTQTRLQPLCPDGWAQLVLVQLERQQPSLAVQALDHLRAFDPRRAMSLESMCSAELHGV